jgi:predicted RNA binding protein YcfA (HicA-like mRNA interferase family)
MDRRVKESLKEHGFILVRHGKHHIYRNSKGKTIVISSSPSSNGWVRQLRQIEKVSREQ